MVKVSKRLVCAATAASAVLLGLTAAPASASVAYDNIKPQYDNIKPQYDNIKPQHVAYDNIKPQYDNIKPQLGG